MIPFNVHELKIDSINFRAIMSDKKKFEIRINDRDYHVNDTLFLREYVDNKYTGKVIRVYILHILYGGNYGLPFEMCIMSFNHYRLFN